MEDLLIPKPAAMMFERRKAARWTTPALVAEIEFRAWTEEGKLRHASYKGLRDEADENSVYELRG